MITSTKCFGQQNLEIGQNVFEKLKSLELNIEGKNEILMLIAAIITPGNICTAAAA